MSDQTPPPRRLGAVAAYTGGALTAAGALGVGVLVGQVLIARLDHPGRGGATAALRRRLRHASTPRPRRCGSPSSATPPRPGTACARARETPGALLATWIADAARRPVRLTCPAVVGSVSAWLDAQVEIAIEAGVDLAIIFIGANDVTTRVSEAAAVAYLAEAVTSAARGRRARWSSPPAPTSARSDRSSRRCGGWPAGGAASSRPRRRWPWCERVRAPCRWVTCSARSSTAAPERMFGDDRFHPSDEGYRAAAGGGAAGRAWPRSDSGRTTRSRPSTPGRRAAIRPPSRCRMPRLRPRPRPVPRSAPRAASAGRPAPRAHCRPPSGSAAGSGPAYRL